MKVKEYTCTTKAREKHLGQMFKTNNFGSVVVIQYFSAQEVWVKFLDTGFEAFTNIPNLQKGNLKDRLRPSIYWVGVVGDKYLTRYKLPNGKSKKRKEYEIWSGFLERCYSEKCQIKHPTYRGCAVSENFKSYTYFYEWCNKQVGFDKEGWHLDNDILVKGNKVYSEDTCCFVPQEINGLFVKAKRSRGDYSIGVSYLKSTKKFHARLSTHTKQITLGYYDTAEQAFFAYKQAKEQHIKDVANKWKEQIDIKVYEALTCYKVDIDD